MKLFDDFEAVRFPEENLIFITTGGYIYYIYNPEHNFWRKHRNAGNDHITVSNYEEVSKEELASAMGGSFPKKETEFMRLCNPEQLRIWDMLDLFGEDYPRYMSDWDVRNTVHHFLLESDICHKSYLKLRELFDRNLEMQKDNESVLAQVKELSFDMIGRDIFKKEIGIVDGHDGSSYFWIMPVRVIDFADTDSLDTVAEMKSVEISIEEDDVAQYLAPFLYKYFDGELEANKKRVNDRWVDEDGKEQFTYVEGFEWYLTHNFYTFDAMRHILNDIRDTVDALSSSRETEYTKKLIEKKGTATYKLLYARDLSKEQVDAYNANRPKKDDTEVNLIIDFYHRFLYRIEYMLTVGNEKGYNLISFMGP